MNQNTRKTISLILLLAGVLLLAFGKGDFYSYAAIACVVIAMILGGYWKPKRK